MILARYMQLFNDDQASLLLKLLCTELPILAGDNLRSHSSRVSSSMDVPVGTKEMPLLRLLPQNLSTP